MRTLILTIAFVILFASFSSVVNAQGKSEVAKEIRIQKQQERLEVSTSSSSDDEVETKNFNKNSVVKFESRAGVSKLSVKSDDNTVEEEILLEEDSEVEIGEDASDSGKIKVGKRGNDFTIANLGVRTRTNFPLTVNPETNQLVISTPSGEKTVILPSEAIQNMINNAGFDVVESSEPEEDDSTESGELEDSTISGELDETNDELLLLVNDQGELVYEAEGIDQQRFLGLLPVGIRKKVQVNAETGAVVSVESPFFQRFLDLLSF